MTHNINHNSGVQFGNIQLHFVYINVLSILKHEDNHGTRFVSRYGCQSIYGVSHCIVSKTRTYLFFIPDNGDILFYYIDRYNVRGFTREIHFGISHVRYQYFPSELLLRNYRCGGYVSCVTMNTQSIVNCKNIQRNVIDDFGT